MDPYIKALRQLRLEEITCWYRNGIFNHMEYGHSKRDHPEGKTKTQQNAWKGIWHKLWTYGDYSRKPLTIITRHR